MKNLRVTLRAGVAFVPLPRELWTVSLDGKCSCAVCKRRGGISYWDTLAVPVRDGGKTWVVHYPELHPDEVER